MQVWSFTLYPSIYNRTINMYKPQVNKSVCEKVACKGVYKLQLIFQSQFYIQNTRSQVNVKITVL